MEESREYNDHENSEQSRKFVFSFISIIARKIKLVS